MPSKVWIVKWEPMTVTVTLHYAMSNAALLAEIAVTKLQRELHGAGCGSIRQARIGRPLKNEQQGYSVQDGVPVLPIFGVIAKRMNLLMEISGGISPQPAQRDIQAALTDPTVKAVILLLDSPGGEVDGTQGGADGSHTFSRYLQRSEARG